MMHRAKATVHFDQLALLKPAAAPAIGEAFPPDRCPRVLTESEKSPRQSRGIGAQQPIRVIVNPGSSYYGICRAVSGA